MMAYVLIITCVVTLTVLLVPGSLGEAIVPCTNDCGYTLSWSAWSCDTCAANGNTARRYRGLCCKSETKDHCLWRCHKTETDIVEVLSCDVACHTTTASTATAITTTASTATTSTSTASTPTASTITVSTASITTASTVSTTKTPTSVPALSTDASSTPVTVPTVGSQTGSPATPSVTTGSGPSLSASSAISPASVNGGSPSILPSNSSVKAASSTINDTNNTSKLCTWLCGKLLGENRCAGECSHQGSFCTILAISLFILGVLIGAVTTATIVRCCCHDRTHARKLRPTRNKDVTMVRECNTDDPPPTDRIDISTPQKEKRELRRVMELAKNHRQVSPFSSSANLMEADWSRGDGEESPRVPTKRWSGSIPTDQVTEQFETKMKPSFFVGARPSSRVMRTPGAFTDSHTGTIESGPIKSRGNIWLSE